MSQKVTNKTILSPTSQIGHHHKIVNITVTVRDISKISSNWSPKSSNCQQYFVSNIRQQHGCHHCVFEIHKLERILKNKCFVSEALESKLRKKRNMVRQIFILAIYQGIAIKKSSTRFFRIFRTS